MWSTACIPVGCCISYWYVKFINWEGTFIIYAGSGNMDAGWMS